VNPPTAQVFDRPGTAAFLVERDAGRAFNDAAHFTLDRITHALVLFDCAPHIPGASDTDTSLQGESL
jgi:hypothetical protein